MSRESGHNSEVKEKLPLVLLVAAVPSQPAGRTKIRVKTSLQPTLAFPNECFEKCRTHFTFS